MDWFEYEINKFVDLKERGRPVVLFGAGFVGINACFYVQALKMNVVGFCDNDSSKSGSVVCGLHVYSLNEIIKMFIDPVIIVCISNSYEAISAQLKEKGLSAVFSWLMPYYIYVTKVIKRPVNSSEFAHTLFCEKKIEQALFFPSIAFRVTQVCSLNCKDCFYFVPYDKHPIHYDKDFLIKCLSNFMDCVDKVEMLGLTGGEPFMHPDIGYILKNIAKHSNIVQINVTTNGTIVPKPEVLDIIADNGIIVQISNYGSSSVKVKELEQEGIKRGILFLTSPMSLNWFKPQTTERFNRSADMNKSLYNNCTVRRYCDGIIDIGDFETCGYGSRRVRLGMIPRDGNCHVNITNENIDVRKRREMIRTLLQKDFLSYCDYCDSYKDLVPAGVQAVGKIKYKKYYER